MAVDINCSDPDHASNSGYPGWADVVGTVPDGEAPPDGMICAGCQAAIEEAEEEDLAGAQDRLMVSCKQYLGYLFEAPGDQGGLLIEYPASSGKYWSISFVDQQYWAKLQQAANDLTYPVVRRTWNERDKHSFANALAINAIFDIVRDTVLDAIDACDTAIDNIMAATTIEDAVAARDAYVPEPFR